MGVVGGVWITPPLTTAPRNDEPSSTLALVMGALATLSAVMAMLAAHGAIRQSERWRPHRD